ncbi:MAG: hypothetical protein H6600_09405 [Flavobacteriales bacterium]|nr:hypothetical protein [Flavobacteriales bacterium]MCB9198665.1 hypothetical protein [Flavobacteriales bacterium]
MKDLSIILLLLIVLSASSQSTTDSIIEINSDLLIIDPIFLVNSNEIVIEKLPPSPYNINNAHKYIRNNNLTIVILGGFTGFGNIDQAKQKTFKDKYNVTFEYLGCVRYWDLEDEDIYGFNKTMFDFLSYKFETDVRKEFKQIWKE